MSASVAYSPPNQSSTFGGAHVGQRFILLFPGVSIFGFSYRPGHAQVAVVLVKVALQGWVRELKGLPTL
ncbi:hypothetical protein OAG47_00380 [Verrucomicrobiales bacterium]|nr:hypothetical protein [Verrucomicrobiales bacterium]